MAVADSSTYLARLAASLRAHWPENRTVNIVCHGHSVPAGYFATPRVDALHAYPALLHRGLLDRYPFAVLNVIVSAIGGEHSQAGAERFAAHVLCHRPDVVTIDYGLNDRAMGRRAAAGCWERMIGAALAAEVPVLLLTPTWDAGQAAAGPAAPTPLQELAEMIRQLADQHQVGLVDSFAEFAAYVDRGGDVRDLLSWSNHPNRQGHELVARALLRWFPAAG